MYVHTSIKSLPAYEPQSQRWWQHKAIRIPAVGTTSLSSILSQPIRHRRAKSERVAHIHYSKFIYARCNSTLFERILLLKSMIHYYLLTKLKCILSGVLYRYMCILQGWRGKVISSSKIHMACVQMEITSHRITAIWLKFKLEIFNMWRRISNNYTKSFRNSSGKS
jgi:hypothetical protein